MRWRYSKPNTEMKAGLLEEKLYKIKAVAYRNEFIRQSMGMGNNILNVAEN